MQPTPSTTPHPVPTHSPFARAAAFAASRSHGEVCAAIPLDRRGSSAVEDELAEWNADRQLAGDLSAIESLHFLRAFTLPPGEAAPHGRLMVAAVMDRDGGRAEAPHFGALAGVAGRFGQLLQRVGSHVAKRPPIEVLDGHRLPPARTFYAGAPRQSVRQIRADIELHRRGLEVLSMIDGDAPADVVHRHLAAELARELDLAPRADPAPLRHYLEGLASLAALVPLPAGGDWRLRWQLLQTAVIQALRSAGLGGLPDPVLSRFERDERPSARSVAVDDGSVRRLLTREAEPEQNLVTVYCPARPSDFRAARLNWAEAAADWFARYCFRRGSLAGVPTIHFARVTTLDGGRSMLFMSEFDGSWEIYLNEFVTVGQFAVLQTWNNLDGCPPTENGAPVGDFANRFLPFVRSREVHTPFSYSAYPQTTVRHIWRNERLRRALRGPTDRRRAETAVGALS